MIWTVWLALGACSLVLWLWASYPTWWRSPVAPEHRLAWAAAWWAICALAAIVTGPVLGGFACVEFWVRRHPQGQASRRYDRDRPGQAEVSL